MVKVNILALFSVTEEKYFTIKYDVNFGFSIDF